ncbi:copper chaperone PCu(A)C [Dietzia maris]|jgi:hypothetical protein
MRRTPFVAVIAAVALGLAGCTSENTETETETTAAATAGAAPIVVEDAWVKATDVNGGTDHGEVTGDPGSGDSNAHGDGGAMAPVFGIVRNQSDADVRLVEVTSAVSGEAELHETVSGAAGGSMMRAREGGFVIPAGGELVFEPGGNHIMLMGVHESIRTGQDVAVTLTLENGDTSEIVASARSFEGGNEQYQGGE